MFTKLKEKTQKSPASNQDKPKPKPSSEDHLQSINEFAATSPDSHATLAIPGKMSRQSSVSSLVSDMSMVSTSQFINDSPMPNIDNEYASAIGTFDLEESAFPQLSSDLSPQDIYSSLVRESRQKLNSAKFKYQDLLAAYRELEKQNAKIKDALAKSQDRAFKKIAEVKESEKGVRLELDKCQQRLLALEEEKLKSEKPQEEVDAQQARIKELEGALALHMSEESAAKSNADCLSGLVTSFQAEKSKLEEGLRLATEKAMELKKQLSEKETIHSLALAECKRSFHNLLEERDAELKNCRLQMENVRAETDTAKKHANELSTVIASLKADNAAIRSSLASTEKRLDAEKVQLVQEVSRAKDAACEALQGEFEKKIEEHRAVWEREYEKKTQEVEAACHRKYAEALEQSKLALEESWFAKKAADSKHEEEMEAVQTRMSQLSLELDSARMTLHRRTVEADQLRSAQEQLSMQATSDVEQAVAQCRRDMEAQNREEIKRLREELEMQQQQNSQTSSLKTEIDSTWLRLKAEFGDDVPLPEVTSYPEIVDFLVRNSTNLSRSKDEIERRVRTECETAASNARVSLEKEIQAIRLTNDSLQQKLTEQTNQIQILETQGQQMKAELDDVNFLRTQLTETTSRLQLAESQSSEKSQHESEEVNSLHSNIASLNREISEKKIQIASLEEECNQMKSKVEQLESLLAENMDLKQQLTERIHHIEMLEVQSTEKAQRDLSALQALQGNLDMLNQEISQKNEQIYQFRCQLEELDLLRNTNASLQQQLTEKTEFIQNLEAQCGEKAKSESEEINTLREANNLQSREIAQKNEEIHSLNCRCQQFEKDFEEVTRLKCCNEALEKRLADVHRLETESEQLKNELHALRGELENESKKLLEIVPENVTGLCNMVNFVLESHAGIKRQVELVTKERDSVNDLIESLRAQLRQIDSQQQDASQRSEQRIEALTQELSDCKARLDKETNQSAQLRQSLETSQSESGSRVVQLEESLKKLTGENQSVLQQLESERAKLLAAISDNHKLGEQTELLRKEHRQEVAELSEREKNSTTEKNRLAEELKASSIELRRLETKLSVLETELADSKSASQAADGRFQEEVQQTKKKSDSLEAKCATLEMELVECRQKMTLSQELVGKLKSELDSSRKSTEEMQQKFAALKTQSAKKLKLLGDEKCDLEKQLASSLSESDALKLSLAAANDKAVDPSIPSVADLQLAIADLTTRIDAATKTVTDKEIRIAELEFELSDKAEKHAANIRRIQVEHETAQAEAEQRIRFEMKRAVGDFERQLSERDKQISKLTVAETVRSSIVDPERQLRNLERELSEKNAAVEQLVVMYEKQLRDQAADLRQEATSRMQAQSEKHQTEMDGLIEEFRNETKQWVMERQRMADEAEQAKRDREQMVQELKRLSDLLDTARVGGGPTVSPPRNGRSTYESPQFFTPTQSSVLAGSNASPGVNGGMAMQLHEATEYEYLRNILLEYMLGRETHVLWRVIGTVMRFSDEQMAEIATREESKHSRWLLG